MIDISLWTKEFLKRAAETFGDRIWFVGLQGSYGRGEQTETSDIDIVLILDELSEADIGIYNEMLDIMPHRELICGFISGKSELLSWEPSDLFQFYHDTKPILGCLDEVLPLIDGAAVDRAIKIGACNIYHGCVHNMLHEKREETVKELYKAASFVMQALYFKKTGNYIAGQVELIKFADEKDQKIIRTFLDLKDGREIRFQEMSEALMAWSGNLIRTIG
ncbi:MAG: nucleotidyltransferase domain-containing protein [Oscillospiraceae bacterium]|nr:nucleotidyltransferase domain-containing protein [Oscillospiraceae bacterium]